MMLKETELENYLFEKEDDLTEEQKLDIEDKLLTEMSKLFMAVITNTNQKRH